MSKQHQYAVSIAWTGNDGSGTQSYRSYRRDHEIAAAGKPPIPGSSDPAFRGDRARYNPEELLVASLSSCHMLWYLHLCSVNGIVVLDYHDEAAGTLQEEDDGAGTFVRVVLKPRVTVAGGSDRGKALALHEEAHHLCFIARSVRFPVEVAAQIAD
ncbi:MAG TPA: OsmC family protein [Steroidobacteraceae bacterium]|nr:OsmC family protein [Steroidobacteraceae bacterium]